MKITAEALHGKKIGFFGLGKSNLALLSALPHDAREINLRSDKAIDRGALPTLPIKYRFFEGERALSEMDEDIIFFSPSVRRDRRELLEARARGVMFSSDAELFFENAKAPIYAVTGSDGKSTTATLAAKILEKTRNVRLIGNIGEPMFRTLSENVDCYVAELSSFMLSYSSPRVKRGCVTNITPNHLDWHSSFEEYKGVKLSLLEGADEKILSFDDEILAEYAKKHKIFAVTSVKYDFYTLKKLAQAEVYLTFNGDCVFLNGEELIKADNLGRRELYNVKNLMSAIALTYGEASKEDILSSAESFSGLSHRCEPIGSYSGVDYYDSSIDSSPARTIETLFSLGRRVVIILGGRSKGVSYAPLVSALRNFAHAAVLTGECADEIYKDIKGSTRIIMVDNFEDAVLFAMDIGKECGAVLLSPASTSYDAFKNYEERGEYFRRCIEKNALKCK